MRRIFPSKSFIWLALLAVALVLAGVGLLRSTNMPGAPQNRRVALAYLSTAAATPSLWRANLDGSGAVQLSLPGEKVLDFSPSRDGNWLVYTAADEQGGSSLWLVERDGASRRKVVTCGAERCSSPAWAPDGKRIAFSRQSARDAHPRIWLLRLDTNQSTLLFEDAAVYGSAALWSPDGRRISVYDPAWKAIRILDLESGQSQTVATQYQTAGSWSADGQLFFYVNLEEASIPPRGMAYQLDAKTGFSLQLFSLGPQDLDYSLPQLSPDGSTFLVGRRLQGGSHSVQLWLMNTHGNQEQAISADFLTTRGAYSWDATGKWVIYQQLELGSSRAQPEVILWERATGSATVILRQAAQPKWLL